VATTIFGSHAVRDLRTVWPLVALKSGERHEPTEWHCDLRERPQSIRLRFGRADAWHWHLRVTKYYRAAEGVSSAVSRPFRPAECSLLIVKKRRDRGGTRPDKGRNERCRGCQGGTSGLERRLEWHKTKLGDQEKRNRHGR